MLATAATFTIEGVRSREILVEVDLRQGLPAFTVVGLADTAVREARERVRAATLNSGLEFPLKRVTANLAPAYLRKTGATFDLALAVALLSASGQLPDGALEGCAICGELSLSGDIRSMGGAIAMAFGARERGYRRLVVPEHNAPEAALVDGIEVFGVPSLGRLVELLTGSWTPSPVRPARRHRTRPPGSGLDLADVRGQDDAKRALEIAAAGGHSLLMIGPPGAGKTMLARRLPGILPPPTFDETVEITNVHSIAGLGGRRLACERPFRAPHHTISAPGLVGGGNRPAPGEITLAHRGVLFLDELAEFSRAALEALRQPLEDGRVVVTRAQRTIDFPAAVMLVGASNPCPCGRAGGECSCGAAEHARYLRRLSGPLVDRIDLVCELAPTSPRALVDEPSEEPSATVRARVLAARERQGRRLAGAGVQANGAMDGPLTRRHVRLGPDAVTRMLEGHLQLGLSGRGHDRVLRLARTIADLAGREHVEARDIDEALGFRMPPALSEAA
ncbi:MAG: YifB family Mg chelatase-like AAA ATPase [Thermoleophilaceae bacterium]